MENLKFKKSQKKKLIGVYKRCIEACTFDMIPNKKWKDPYTGFKRRVRDKISFITL